MNRLTIALAASAALAGTAAAQTPCRSAPSYFRAEKSVVPTRLYRAVNDFNLPAGNGGVYRLTHLSARVATNTAPPFEVWFEVYASDANGQPGNRIAEVKATSLTPTGRTLTISNIPGQEEHLASIDLSAIPEILAQPGQRLWIGAAVHDTFSMLARGWIVADAVNPISTRPPMIRDNTAGEPNPWTSAPGRTCDLAVSIGATQYCRADINRDGVVASLDHSLFLRAFRMGLPEADFNRDGAVTTADVYDFLAAYSSGCTAVHARY